MIFVRFNESTEYHPIFKQPFIFYDSLAENKLKQFPRQSETRPCCNNANAFDGQ